jgi:AraC family transcriptional regulator, regulatory protein of adaptative response / DNA-3-methyladenine glycosylase II
MLASKLKCEAGFRVPGCWGGFELVVLSILGQQVDPQTASTLAGRLAEGFGRRFSPAPGITRLFPTAEALAEADLDAADIPAFKAQTIQALARGVRDGQIKFEGIGDCDEFLARLGELPGFSKWAAQYVAMRALRDPDAFPSDDVILRSQAGNCSAIELERRSERWRPWRAYAALLLWQTVAATESVSRISARPGALRETHAGRCAGTAGHD